MRVAVKPISPGSIENLMNGGGGKWTDTGPPWLANRPWKHKEEAMFIESSTASREDRERGKEVKHGWIIMAERQRRIAL